ncbi:type IV secretion protein Rhs [Enterobacter sp. Ap-1006]|uniref:type IV secretion protein Rhs n=1 Tax=Enterobacter sp. Ap-1006 TaxID=2608345 RepID=UPI00141DADA8|nr:type IV secretion protein Rhs [Enterobacter sp. Ap-1006]NIF49402.1 type IV secretion protein Rhs [Enterobacter sp. Ap-1006]
MSAQAEEGSLRRMTLGEIAMARRVFGDSISYSRVWIHCDSYLPFGLQKQNYAMTPNGELWYRKTMYKDDFSSGSVFLEDKYVFIHELVHVWQHQHGQWVRLRGAFSWAAEYTYKLDKEALTDYSLEQQASILADYWLLLVYGIDAWSYYQRPGRMGKYRGTDSSREVPVLYRKIVTGKVRTTL